MPDDVREFARQAREFLDAHATRAEQAEFRWGQGEDTVAYFNADPPDVKDVKLHAAKDWQRTRYERVSPCRRRFRERPYEQLLPAQAWTAEQLDFDGPTATATDPDAGELSSTIPARSASMRIASGKSTCS